MSVRVSRSVPTAVSDLYTVTQREAPHGSQRLTSDPVVINGSETRVCDNSLSCEALPDTRAQRVPSVRLGRWSRRKKARAKLDCLVKDLRTTCTRTVVKDPMELLL